MQDQDIIIAGGGIAGMIATLVFAQRGFATTCVDPAPPVTGDMRSTAFLAPSVALLDRAGIFDALRDHAAPLRIMRLVDAGGEENQIRTVVDFEAAETGAEAFGWNIPNMALRTVLAKAIENTPNAQFRPNTAVTGVSTRLRDAVVRFGDGTNRRCRLLVAADGRDSQLREDAGIKAHRTRYGQKALVFTVTHERPHDGVSTEVHRSGGPFTLVPLAGAAQDRSAVVWMETGPEAMRLFRLPDDGFERALNARSCGVQGPIRLASKRVVWPIIAQRAARLYADRMVLIAEAAHVVPPIGAQGLNMSLADIAVLADLFAQHPDDIGGPAVLQAYHRARMNDIRMRISGIDMLNRAAMSQQQLLRDLRGAGLRAIGQSGIKQPLMKFGLGAE